MSAEDHWTTLARGRVRERLGPFVERYFGLLFTATTITTSGDRLAFIALAFAVLDLPGATATDLGIVLASRQVVEALVVVGCGVLSDRLPRHHVLVGASLVQATSQAATAALICLACWGTMLSCPSVWAIRARPDERVTEPPPVPQTPAEERLAFDP